MGLPEVVRVRADVYRTCVCASDVQGRTYANSDSNLAACETKARQSTVSDGQKLAKKLLASSLSRFLVMPFV